MRTRKHHKKTQTNKRHRRLQERSKLINEQRRKEMAERDADVTSKYGDTGHRTCGRKIRYATKSEALVKASKCMRHGAPALSAYRCPYCGGWHLTSRVRKGQTSAKPYANEYKL